MKQVTTEIRKVVFVDSSKRIIGNVWGYVFDKSTATMYCADGTIAGDNSVESLLAKYPKRFKAVVVEEKTAPKKRRTKKDNEDTK
jgi:hypothetical protein